MCEHLAGDHLAWWTCDHLAHDRAGACRVRSRHARTAQELLASNQLTDEFYKACAASISFNTEIVSFITEVSTSPPSMNGTGPSIVSQGESLCCASQALRDRGYECMVSLNEADGQLAHHSKTSYVTAVITEDGDLAAYGCDEVPPI